MGMLSRYPIVQNENFKLAKHGLVYQQRAIIDIAGTRTRVYNIHLTYPHIRVIRNHLFSCFPWLVYHNDIRREEVKNLITLFQREQYPIIAGGDFNLTPYSQDYRQLVKSVTDHLPLLTFLLFS